MLPIATLLLIAGSPGWTAKLESSPATGWTLEVRHGSRVTRVRELRAFSDRTDSLVLRESDYRLDGHRLADTQFGVRDLTSGQEIDFPIQRARVNGDQSGPGTIAVVPLPKSQMWIVGAQNLQALSMPFGGAEAYEVGFKEGKLNALRHASLRELDGFCGQVMCRRFGATIQLLNAGSRFVEFDTTHWKVTGSGDYVIFGPDRQAYSSAGSIIRRWDRAKHQWRTVAGADFQFVEAVTHFGRDLLLISSDGLQLLRKHKHLTFTPTGGETPRLFLVPGIGIAAQGQFYDLNLRKLCDVANVPAWMR